MTHAGAAVEESVVVSGVAVRCRVAPGRTTQARSLLRVFEAQAQAQSWRDGFVLWFGWGPYVLRASSGGFVVHAPDYTVDPTGGWTDDLTDSLDIVTQMTAWTTRVGVPAQDVRFADRVIATRGWEHESRLQMVRSTPVDGDSGWFLQPFPPVGSGDWQAADLLALPAWQALQLRPAVGACLALPVGIAAVVRRDEVEAVIRQEDGELLYCVGGDG